MGDSFDRIMDVAGKAAGAAVKTTGKLVDKGRGKAEELALQNRLGKLQRQLGALVYALRKNDEENDAMIAWYVEEIDRVRARLLLLQTGSAVRVMGTEGGGDAMFRGRNRD